MSTPATIIVGLIATAAVAGVCLAVRSLWEQVFGDDPELGPTVGPGNDTTDEEGVAAMSSAQKRTGKLEARFESSIKPCRLCGGAGRLSGLGLRAWVECDTSHCMVGPQRNSYVEAMDAWNSIHAPAEPQREEGVVAYVTLASFEALRDGGGSGGLYLPKRQAGFQQRVRIIPEPEPESTYTVTVQGRGSAYIIKDGDRTQVAASFTHEHHPDPEGTARAHADDLNQRDQER